MDPDARKLVARLRREVDLLTEAVGRASGVLADVRAMLDRSDAAAPALQIHDEEAEPEEPHAAADDPAVPHWDGESRTLSVGRRIVKRFRVPSRNQETVLAAFQEEGWPRRIDDPLPYRAGLKAKYRLHFTIGRLNRCGRDSFIRFFGDGTGEGVCWDFAHTAFGSSAAAANWQENRRRAA